MKVKVKIANKFWLCVFYIMSKLYGTNIIGFTTFWNTIIIRKEQILNDKLLAHELTHIEQINKLGVFKFTFEYIKQLLKNGYANNKFEINARQNEANPKSIICKFDITRYF